MWECRSQHRERAPHPFPCCLTLSPKYKIYMNHKTGQSGHRVATFRSRQRTLFLLPLSTISPFLFIIFNFFNKIFLFWLYVLVAACKIFSCVWKLLVEACGIQFPDQGSNLSSLHWKLRALATRPPGKSQPFALYVSVYRFPLPHLMGAGSERSRRAP